MSDTVPETLVRAAERGVRGRDGIRFLDRRERASLIDWQEILSRTMASAGALSDAGITAGDRVAIILPTGPEFFDAYLGAQWLGAVPVPLYPPVRLGRLDEYFERTTAMLHAVGASILVSDRRVRRVLGSLMNRARLSRGLVDAASLQRGAGRPRADIDPDGLGMIQFSSGTTVQPKAVALSHRQMLSNARPILDLILSFEQEAPGGVSWLPLYHDMGLIGCLFPAMMEPGPLTLIPPEVFLSRPAIWLRALSRYPATVSPAPDFAYALCVERIKDEDLEGVDLSNWVMALNGAESIAPRTLRAFQARFGPYGLCDTALTPVYGLSEAALAVTFSDVRERYRVARWDRAAFARGMARPAEGLDPLEVVSVGRPLPKFGVEVRDAEGQAMEDREGRIWVRGPSVMGGYFGLEETPIVDGWLDTGDLGVLQDGELYVTGRAKDVIVLRGQNHAPQEIERAASAVAGVRTGCVVAVGEVGADGERMVLFVEVREQQLDLAEEIARAVRRTCGIAPDELLLVEPGTIPRTSSGKLRRGETLRRWREGGLTPPERVTAWLLAGAMARSAWGFATDYLRPRGSS